MSAPLLDPIPGILDLGGLSLLNGSSGIGKTALAAGIAAHLRTATTLFGYAVNTPVHIAYMCVERAWIKGSKHWFDVAGFPDVPVYALRQDRALDLNRFLASNRVGTVFGEILAKWKLPPGTLLIVDPFALFVGNVMNPHLAAVMLMQVARHLEDAQISGLGLMHSVKETNDPKTHYHRANDRMGGTTWLSGYTDAQLSLLAPDQTASGRYQFHITPHNFPSSVHALERKRDGGFDIDGAELLSGQVPEPTIIASAWPPELLTVLERLLKAPCTTGDLIALYAADSGPVAARKRIERALVTLKAQGYVTSPRKGHWCLLKMPTIKA